MGDDFAALALCGTCGRDHLRPRLPARGRARAGLASEVPAARRPPGPARRSGRRGRSAAARAPATSRSARPRPGCATCSTQARARTLPGMVRTGVTFADAGREYLRYVEHDRDRKPSTLRDYRSIDPRAPAAGLRRRCGSRTSRRPDRGAGRRTLRMSNRTQDQAAHGPQRRLPRARRVYGCRVNPMADVEKPRAAPPTATSRSSRPRRSGRSSAPPTPSRTPRSSSPPPSPACAAASCVALRWRDVDFAAPAHPRVAAQLRRRRARRRRRAARCARCRWRRTSPRRSPGSASASAGPATTISSSRASPAATSTRRRCAAATSAALAARRPAAAALPRPAPHVRHADDRQGRHPPRPGVDGPRRRRRRR